MDVNSKNEYEEYYKKILEEEKRAAVKSKNAFPAFGFQS